MGRRHKLTGAQSDSAKVVNRVQARIHKTAGQVRTGEFFFPHITSHYPCYVNKRVVFSNDFEENITALYFYVYNRTS